MDVRKVVVLGAGNMGSGIAQAAAQAGLDVVVRDLRPELLEAGRARIEGPLRKRVAAGKAKAEEVDALLGRIRWTTAIAEAVADADLVIEAVFEDLEVKRKVFAEVAAAARPECVLATNTSSLRVTDIARATDRPDRVGGLHFFYPAAVNKLVEVVAGEGTRPEVVDGLVTFARRIGKIPIRTSDAAGFCVNRFFVPWLNEAVRIVEEGVADVPTVEAAAKEAFGIGMGPFELMNVTGVPISLHAETSLHRAFGEAYRPAKLIESQVAAKEAWDLAGTPDAARVPLVRDRLLGVAFGIAARLVEEGVATPSDTDKGATVGLRWAKGPFELMNSLGTARSLALVRAYAARWGDAFPVSAELAGLGARDAPWPLPLVRVERRGHVAIVTVDRPDALNALNDRVLADLGGAFLALRSDPDVRAVVLTGEGQKAFVAGADIRAMSTKTPLEARAFTALGQDVFRRIETFPRPVVAAVNGFALGGGLELALACDLVLASDKALFGLPEVSLGIHPGFGGTQRLPRAVGTMRAKELVFTGRRFGAEEAKAMGLVLEVVPAAELLGRALALAEEIARQAPVAVALAKDVMNRASDVDLETGLAHELAAVTLTFATEDQKNAMRAFLEKKGYEFRGK